ncbi:MAG: SdpI family protein [Nanoarchaeota archaeon]
MRKAYLFSIILLIVLFALSVCSYQVFPNKIASHWNAQGMADSYTNKFWGLFLIPIISLGVFLLFLLIPVLDPLRKNISKFRRYFDTFTVIIILFFLYLHILTILFNLGIRFNFTLMLMPALAILIFYSGILIENAKRNWFVGIRTPWTLSSDKVWNKTHEVGGRLFKASAVIMLLGIFFPKYSIFFIIVPLLFSALFSFIYSYYVYKKLRKKY